jgi:hypothetical protein
MRSLRQRIARFGIGLGLATTMALGAVVPALADDTPVGTLTLTAGARTVDAADFSFASRALTGVAQTSTASPAITVTNATGDDQGWVITMEADPFVDAAGTPHALVADPRIATKPTLTGGALTTGSITTPYTTAVHVSTQSEIAAVDATQAGNGVFTLTPTITIDIPANAQTPVGGSYSSTVTITIAPNGD